MTDYDIDIRDLEPTYKHTLARQANREVDDGREIHLTELSVTVVLKEPTGERERYPYVVTFGVDHESHTVSFKQAGDPHDNRHRFAPERYWLATSTAAEVVDEWLTDIGLAYERPDVSIVLPAEPEMIQVHNDLTVVSEEVSDDA
jgi:hypothetical protein